MVRVLVGMHLGKVQIWAELGRGRAWLGADMININEARQASHLQDKHAR